MKINQDQPVGFVREMLTHLRISIVATVVLAIVVCGIYPVVVWGLAQLMFHHQANGSLIKKDGTPTDNDAEAVGSSLLGQPFGDAKYFHPRPSAAGNGYDSTASSGSNFGPLSAKLLNGTTKPSTSAIRNRRRSSIMTALNYARSSMPRTITSTSSMPHSP